MVTILDRRLLHHRPSIPDLHFLNADFILSALNLHIKLDGALELILKQ